VIQEQATQSSLKNAPWTFFSVNYPDFPPSAVGVQIDREANKLRMFAGRTVGPVDW
jgi:hypothetical protein